MEKVARILAASAIALAPFIISNSAFAAGTCQIGYTGPNSNNECTLTSSYTCTVKNENDFEIRNENNQVVGSGTAANTGNTSGGNAFSGSATNSNGTTINVSIDNGDSGKLCSVVKTVPATNPPTVNPPVTTPPASPPAPQSVTPNGGRGSVNPPVVKQAVRAPQKTAPAVLPNTSSNESAMPLIATTGLLAAGTVVTRLVVAGFGRFKS